MCIFKNPAYIHLKIRVYRYILSGRLFYCNFLDPKRSTLVTGSIPSENLPSRAHDVPDPAPRRPIVRVIEGESKRTKHSSLKSIVGNLKQMVLGQWKFEEQESLVKLHLFDNEHVLPKFVVIYSSLKFRVSIFGWDLILSHPIYKQNEQSVEFLSIRDLLDTLESYTLCSGVPKLSCVAKNCGRPVRTSNLKKEYDCTSHNSSCQGC